MLLFTFSYGLRDDSCRVLGWPPDPGVWMVTVDLVPGWEWAFPRSGTKGVGRRAWPPSQCRPAGAQHGLWACPSVPPLGRFSCVATTQVCTDHSLVKALTPLPPLPPLISLSAPLVGESLPTRLWFLPCTFRP